MDSKVKGADDAVGPTKTTSMFLPNGSAIFAQALEPLRFLPLKTSRAHHTLCEIIPTTGV